MVGCSTGYMHQEREDWEELVVQAAGVSGVATELSALSEPELPGLISYLRSDPMLPFRFISVHGPSKQRRLGERELVELLTTLPAWVDAIVMHPDTIEEPSAYRLLGRRLAIENMDIGKATGRDTEELAGLFEELPQAGLCFDIAHAKSVDPELGVGEELLDRYASRLRHVHVSSLDEDLHHVPIIDEDELRYAPLLAKCRDVPWILEAPES
jgi:Xylose isomerase-like TIM barrel